ncbi:hypothetical protein QR685DRAFT_606996 [Neurospora intermedia]|uniref:Uncharacterized protein n=1 Tax=Neurospora intermedia TaxID=5142 RepID=A0ABR3DB86_NEUIN
MLKSWLSYYKSLQSLHVTGEKADSKRDEESRLAGEANPPNRRVMEIMTLPTLQWLCTKGRKRAGRKVESLSPVPLLPVSRIPTSVCQSLAHPVHRSKFVPFLPVQFTWPKVPVILSEEWSSGTLAQALASTHVSLDKVIEAERPFNNPLPTLAARYDTVQYRRRPRAHAYTVQSIRPENQTMNRELSPWTNPSTLSNLRRTIQQYSSVQKLLIGVEGWLELRSSVPPFIFLHAWVTRLGVASGLVDAAIATPSKYLPASRAHPTLAPGLAGMLSSSVHAPHESWTAGL